VRARFSHIAIAAAYTITATLLLLATAPARGEDESDSNPTPTRPAVLFNRWQEDWSVLADPNVPKEPYDALKYIPLSPDDPKTYLSFGADVRERFETNDAAGFGTGPNRSANYVISRTELHADLRVASQLQIFTQLQSDFAPWKSMLTPVDRDRLDLEQAFAVLVEPLEGGILKLRLGRQQFAFDLQRFVAVRDGPNIRQSYDAAWADYENGHWRFITFYSQPVQNRDLRTFDDYSNGHLTFSGVRLERKFTKSIGLTTYYGRFKQDGAHFPSAHGNERRDIFDLRFTGTADQFDWDLEAMGQTGHLADQAVRAWAVGSLAGWTAADILWTPRFGIQIDAASGDNNPHDHVLGTFNPLFPNGYYVTLAGYTGYVNFIHVKPSVTLHLIQSLKLLLAAGLQWRETTGDAIYTQPDIPVPNTAGHPGLYTGTYGQIRLDWAIDSQALFAIEAVHFAVGDAIQRAGGHDSDYAGIEIKYGW
jgi:hypothetical protein